MTHAEMTSMQRVLTTLGHQEPDRVPFFLLASLHGARELGLSIQDYFSRPEHVVEGQLRIRAKYRHDCLYGFFYAPIDVQAWGGEVVFAEDGPPNSGRPFIRNPEDILRLAPPKVEDADCLVRVLRAIEGLTEASGGEVPVIGVVMSPFSVPVMQMGFDRYIELIYEQPLLFDRLMKVNEAFCVDWANAQLRAGAAAICMFDPVSSATIVPPDLYRKTGFPSACRTIARIQAPVATHLASGRGLPIFDDLAKTGTVMAGVSAEEDLDRIKAACRGKLAVLGNLDGITMRRWTPKEAEARVKNAIAEAGPGGGFILGDNHGEIPWQVPDEVLMAVSDAVRRWGRYPLDWIAESVNRTAGDDR
ncbi:MAG: uroporphyrinogen decarboxylase family protein [Thermodesulfobacteriota bacterium]